MEAYERLEQEWSATIGVKNMVACSSGTAALHLALEAMRLPPGGEVIVPNFTMVACPRAVVMAGLTPVFVDCLPNGQMDPYLARVAVTGKTAAIMAVHVYGRWCNTQELHCLTTEFRLKLIEDCAECPFAYESGDYIPDAACWSFYKNKVVAGEEGGAVAFGLNPDCAALARSLRSQGFTDQHDFMHNPRGCNYRLSNANAGLVLESLKGFGRNVAIRRDLEALYDEACPVEWKLVKRLVPWVYDLRIRGMSRFQQDSIIKELNRRGVTARHAFKPMTWQSEFKDCRLVDDDGCAARLSHELIYLPFSQETVGRVSPREIFAIVRSAL